MKLTKRALAPLALTGLMAGSCGVANAYVIQATSVPPLTLMDLGTGNGNGLQTSITSPLNEPGVTISFTGQSGVYSGNVSTAKSPFGSGDKNYLAAEPKGMLTLSYSNPQTEFDLLWGTVDIRNVLDLAFSSGSTITKITGQNVYDSINSTNPITLGTTTQAVKITGLPTFDKVSVTTGSSPAFEFVPGVASVPEPGALALMGLGLIGLCASRLRRTV